MVETISAWQCIGCGRIDAPQPCVGVCEDRKIALVSAGDYEAAMQQRQQAEAQIATLLGLTRLLASTTPSEGQWQRTYLALQQRARALLAEVEPPR